MLHKLQALPVACAKHFTLYAIFLFPLFSLGSSKLSPRRDWAGDALGFRLRLFGGTPSDPPTNSAGPKHSAQKSAIGRIGGTGRKRAGAAGVPHRMSQPRKRNLLSCHSRVVTPAALARLLLLLDCCLVAAWLLLVLGCLSCSAVALLNLSCRYGAPVSPSHVPHGREARHGTQRARDSRMAHIGFRIR